MFSNAPGWQKQPMTVTPYGLVSDRGRGIKHDGWSRLFSRIHLGIWSHLKLLINLCSWHIVEMLATVTYLVCLAVLSILRRIATAAICLISRREGDSITKGFFLKFQHTGLLLHMVGSTTANYMHRILERRLQAFDWAKARPWTYVTATWYRLYYAQTTFLWFVTSSWFHLYRRFLQLMLSQSALVLSVARIVLGCERSLLNILCSFNLGVRLNWIPDLRLPPTKYNCLKLCRCWWIHIGDTATFCPNWALQRVGTLNLNEKLKL